MCPSHHAAARRVHAARSAAFDGANVIHLPVFQAGAEFCGRIDQSPCDGCDSCGARCTAGVEIGKAEFHAIQDELAAFPRAERERVLAQSKDVTVPGTDYAYTACRFRDV